MLFVKYLNSSLSIVGILEKDFFGNLTGVATGLASLSGSAVAILSESESLIKLTLLIEVSFLTVKLFEEFESINFMFGALPLILLFLILFFLLLSKRIFDKSFLLLFS